MRRAVLLMVRAGRRVFRVKYVPGPLYTADGETTLVHVDIPTSIIYIDDAVTAADRRAFRTGA